MRLATLNLFSGRSLADGRVVAERLHQAVRELDADVLGLQEVDRGQARSGGLDETAEVAAALGVGADGWRFAPALDGTPGEAWEPATGAEERGAQPDRPAYGVGLVTRLPVQRWREVRLPSAPVRSPVLVPSPDTGRPRAIWLRDEPRVGLAAVVETGAGPVSVVTTHLSFVPGWGLVQLRRLLGALLSGPDALPRPVLLAGDLNLPGGLPRLVARGWRPLAEHKTFPGPAPRVQVDHLLALGPGVPAVLATGAPQLAVGDHRALWADLSA